MMRPPASIVRALPVLLSVAAGCSPGVTPSDRMDAALTDASVDAAAAPDAAPCVRTFGFDRGSTTGHAEPLRATGNQSRAGRLSAAQLDAVVDRYGLATWKPGDYVLANARVAVMIEDVGPSELYDPWGGKIVGIARVSDGRLVDAADFNEFNTVLGRFTLQPDSVSVLRDGSDGGAAVIRASGVLRAVPFLDEFARALAPFSYDGVHAALDYTLEPGSDAVSVAFTFQVGDPLAGSLAQQYLGIFQRYRMPIFTPEQGFGSPAAARAVPWVGFVDDDGASFAFRPEGAMLTPQLYVSGFDLFAGGRIQLTACSDVRVPLGKVFVSGPGLDALVQTMAAAEGRTLRAVTVHVTEADGSPAQGVRVHAYSTTTDVPFTRATVNASGDATLHIPAGAPVRLSAWRRGDTPPDAATLAPASDRATIQMRPRGQIRVQITESPSGAALPARVQVMELSGDAPRPPDAFGELVPPGGRRHLEFPISGSLTLPVSTGMHRVVVSRGFEYEIVDRRVEVTAAGTTEVQASLARSVATTGHVCGDFHIHTHRSPDAEDAVRFKLQSIAADGLEIAVRSDHEFVADFQPVIDSMGLSAWVHGVPSIELTTFTWGHFGVVPLTPDPTQPNGGAFEWANRTPQQVFAAVRQRPERPTIIINHPSGGNNYFTMAQLDRASGVGRRPGFWDTEFTAVEVFNESDWTNSRDRSVADWLSILNSGRRVFAVGSSDSHTVYSSNATGYPRTCMDLGTDDPRGLDNNLIRDRVAQGRSYVTGGIHLDVRVGSAGPGQQASGVGSTARLSITARAASWVPVDRIELVVDGTTLRTLPFPASPPDPGQPTVRYSGETDIPVAAGGSYVIVVAHGGLIEPVLFGGKKAFGVSNPIFLSR